MKKVKKRKRSSKPYFQIKIARERIAILFEEAGKTAKKDKILAKRYVSLARKIGMRYNVRLTKEHRRSFCKHCYAYIKPGITSKNTIKNGVVAVKCLGCKKVTRYPYK